MKRTFFACLAVAAAVMAVGAGSASAEMADGFLNFVPESGLMTYASIGTTAQFPDGHDEVNVVDVGWGLVAVQPAGWRLGVLHSSNVEQYCNFYETGWSCPATEVSIKTTKANDTITVGADVKVPTILEGGLGIDWVQGGGSADEIWGGCATDRTCNGFADTLRGGDGNDSLHGGSAVDHLAGEAGIDMLDGGLSGDSLNGGPGNDFADYSKRGVPITASLDGVANDGEAGEHDFFASDVEGVQGGNADDTITGNESGNWLRGGHGNDAISGYGGPDQLHGEAGADLLRPGFGGDGVYGGSGTDTATYGERWNPVNVTLDEELNDGEAGESDYVASDVENLTGGSADDTLKGNELANVLLGGPGADMLDGRSAHNAPDKLIGEAGNDQLAGGFAGSAGDILDGGPDVDVVTYASRTDGVSVGLGGTGGEDKVSNAENAKGGDGDDTLTGGAGPNALFAGPGNDVVDGKAGDDSLYGMNGNDSLYGDTGDDVVAGGDRADILMGGAGADWIAGYDGLDKVTYYNATVPVTVTPDGVADDGAAGEGDNVGSSVEDVVGGHAADNLTGTAGPNTLTGGDGADTLNGLGAADQLDGGPMPDVLNGGDGPDTLDGVGGNDQLFGDAGYDTLRGGPASDELHGGPDGDTADYSTSASAVRSTSPPRRRRADTGRTRCSTLSRACTARTTTTR